MPPTSLVLDLTSWSARPQNQIVRLLQRHLEKGKPLLKHAGPFETISVLLSQASYDTFPRSLEPAVMLNVVDGEAAAAARLQALPLGETMIVARENVLGAPYFGTVLFTNRTRFAIPDMDTRLLLEYGQTETPVSGVSLETVLREALAAWHRKEVDTDTLASAWGLDLSETRHNRPIWFGSHHFYQRSDVTLERILGAEQQKPTPPAATDERREAAVAAVSGDRAEALSLSPIARLALAAQHDVNAAATEAEANWLHHRLGAKRLAERTYERLSPGSLTYLLDRIALDPAMYARVSVAERCTWGEHLFEPGQQYGIDLPGPLRELPAAQGLQFIELPSRSTADLALQLHAELQTWTVDQYAADPLGQHLMERLAPDEQTRSQFLFELARLQASDRLPLTSPQQAGDWRSPLRTLLSSPCPSASLYWETYWKSDLQNGDKKQVVTSPEQVRSKPPAEPEGDSPSPTPYSADLFANHVRTDIPLGRVIRGRSDSIALVSARGRDLTHALGEAGPADYPAFRYPLPSARALARAVLESRDGQQEFIVSDEYWWAGRQPAAPEVEDVAIAPWTWDAADRELAMIWWSLRRALASPSHVQMPDGQVLLHVATGIFAQISVRRFEQAESAPVQASLLAEADRVAYGQAGVYSTHGYGHASTGAALPTLYLVGAGYAADITFVGSPLAVFGPVPLLDQAAEGAQVLFERQKDDEAAAAQAQEEYDDWYDS